MGKIIRGGGEGWVSKGHKHWMHTGATGDVRMRAMPVQTVTLQPRLLLLMGSSLSDAWHDHCQQANKSFWGAGDYSSSSIVSFLRFTATGWGATSYGPLPANHLFQLWF